MTKKKNPAAVSLGSLGGRARAKSLSKVERSEIAKQGAAARITKSTAEQRRRIARIAAAARWAAKKKGGTT